MSVCVSFDHHGPGANENSVADRYGAAHHRAPADPDIWTGLTADRGHISRSTDGADHPRSSGLAGFPTTMVPGATSLVTTAPIPTTAPRPIRSGFSGVPCFRIAPVPM